MHKFILTAALCLFTASCAAQTRQTPPPPSRPEPMATPAPPQRAPKVMLADGISCVKANIFKDPEYIAEDIHCLYQQAKDEAEKAAEAVKEQVDGK